MDGGRPLASLDENSDSYQVRIFNNAKWDALFFLKIDGVDSGFFRDREKPTLWYCPAGKSVVVRGWINEDTLENKQGNEFSWAPPKDSIAAQYGMSGDIGFITATFYRAYKIDEDPRKVDPRERTLGRATRRGENIHQPITLIERKPGPKVRAVLSLPYERRD